MELKYIIIPLVSAFIGYITNSIAITMLFRPLKPKYIGKWQIPFTPGIIPKERKRLAHGVSEAICNHLINSDVISNSLLSKETTDKIENIVDSFVEKYSESDMTLREAADEVMGNDRTTSLAVNMTDKISEAVAKSTVDFSMGEEIASTALTSIKGSFSGEWGYKAVIARLMDTKVADTLTVKLGEQLNELVKSRAPEMVKVIVERETNSIMNLTCAEVLERYKDDIPTIKQSAVSNYTKAVEKYLPQVLDSLDMSKIIEDRINDFEIREAEDIVKSIIDKELKAVIWLGALLGLLIGLINLFFI